MNSTHGLNGRKQSEEHIKNRANSKRIKLDLDKLKKEYLSGKNTHDLSKEFNVSMPTICSRLRKLNILRPVGSKMLSPEQKKSNSKMVKNLWKNQEYRENQYNKKKGRTSHRKGKSLEELYDKETAKRLKKLLIDNRAKQIFPKKDTKIEVKVRKFLDILQIEYFQHKYMNINHSYQCDFFIPELNLVVECDGVYWHSYPTGREIDHIRTGELLSKGFKVLRLWEFEINEMTINEFKGRLK